jgi:hypothetical protein
LKKCERGKIAARLKVSKGKRLVNLCVKRKEVQFTSVSTPKFLAAILKGLFFAVKNVRIIQIPKSSIIHSEVVSQAANSLLRYDSEKDAR